LKYVYAIIFGIILLFPSSRYAYGQKNRHAEDTVQIAEDSIQIDKIFIIGHKKTKEQIIRRELSLYDGQILTKSDLDQAIIADKRKLLNTKLFLTVDFNIVDLTPERVDIIIRLSERWYFFPIPIFDLADRNFTEWWVNQNHSLSRVDYGIKLRHFNFRGRRELLDVTAQFGYTKLFRLAYQFPYINKNQKLGMSFYGDYATNKNVGYETIEHRQQFYGSEEILRDRWRTGVSMSYRPNFYSTHNMGLHYASITVSDSVTFRNPDYFLDTVSNQTYLGLSYNYTWDFRDFVSYPLTGSYFRVGAEIIGLGVFNDVNIFEAHARYSRYFDLGKQFYFGTSVSAVVSTPSKQPYYNYSSVGTNHNFIRGYERYVIEGPNFIISKNTLRRRLFSFDADVGDLVKIKQFSKIPLAAYFTLNFDQGYVVNYPDYPDNTLFTNKYIYGGGFGIDIISFYDFVMRWEYSWNIEGQSALYLNLFAAF
jgi:outer membrane protein assembly factor BamA